MIYCIANSTVLSDYTTHIVLICSTSPYVCTEACVRVRFQRELETRMASQYIVWNYFRQRLTDATVPRKPAPLFWTNFFGLHPGIVFLNNWVAFKTLISMKSV